MIHNQTETPNQLVEVTDVANRANNFSLVATLRQGANDWGLVLIYWEQFFTWSQP